MDNLAYVHNSVLPLLSDSKHRNISNNVNITEIIIAMTAGNNHSCCSKNKGYNAKFSNYTDFLLLE